MNTYLIEREIPGASGLSHEDLRGITSTSNDAVESLNKPYKWLHSYVAGDKVLCTLRYAHAGDREAIVRLAQLDSQREPTGTLLVAESEAGIVAALPLEGGDAIANPFVRTAELVEVLRLRAAQLSSEPNSQPRGLRRRITRQLRPATVA